MIVFDEERLLSAFMAFEGGAGMNVRKDPRFNEACQKLADIEGIPFGVVHEIAWGGIAGITQAGMITKLKMPLVGMSVEERLVDFVAQVETRA